MKEIFVFDSGSGGEFVTKELLRVLPREKFILFKDEANCPYGTKGKWKLWCIAKKLLNVATKNLQPKAIVVACNTMSCLFEKKIREKYRNTPILFVTPEVDKEKLREKTLILATTRTACCNQLSRVKDCDNFIVVGFDDLAKRIDRARVSPRERADLKLFLLNNLSKYKPLGMKNMVLACTHYVYIKKYLREIFGNVKFYEKSKNVAKNLKKLLNDENSEQNVKDCRPISQRFREQVKVVARLEDLTNLH